MSMAVTDCSTKLADQLNVCCSLSVIKPRLHVVRNAALMTIFELSVRTYVSSLELTMAFATCRVSAQQTAKSAHQHCKCCTSAMQSLQNRCVRIKFLHQNSCIRILQQECTVQHVTSDNKQLKGGTFT